MRHVSLASIAMLLGGCSGGGSAPAREPAPAPAPTSVASAAPATPPADLEPTARVVATAEPSAEAPTTIERPASCAGTGLDLDRLFAEAFPNGALPPPGAAPLAGACGYNGETSALAPLGGPEAIEISVDVRPSPLPPGATGRVTATFKNVTDSPRSVLFARSCGDPLVTGWAADPKSGERADLIVTPPTCGGGRGCSREMIVVTLEPGGTATASGTYVARMMRLYNDECVERPDRVLAPGSYELRLETPLYHLPATDRTGRGTPRRASSKLEVGRRK